MRQILWIIVLFCVVGCFKRRTPLMQVMDPDTVVMVARTRSIPQTLRARFSVHISTPQQSVTLPGSLLIDQPNRVRAEIYSPFGTPLMYMVSDGQGLHAWDQRQKTFFHGAEAGEVLGHLTGGTVGLEDLLSVLTARLPMPDSEILLTGRTVFQEGGVELMLMGPDEMSVRTVVNPSNGVLTRLQVWEGEASSDLTRAEGGMILDVKYTGETRIGRARLPETITMNLPQMGWTITIKIRSWSIVEASPTAFQLKAPSGARVVELADAIKRLSLEKPGEHPEP